MRSGGKIELYHMDNMELMAQYPDNHFELAIVDPPYGSKNIQGGYTKGIGGKGSAKQLDYCKSLWEFNAPDLNYFKELIRVSKNQIIWGANHFISRIPYDSSCWLIWDKKNENTGYADCEMAWTSFDKAVRKFGFRWNGMLQENMKNKEVRIHPTQKPVALYQWILKNYAKEGDKILDTHLGSGSIAIACHKMKFDLVACEIDQEYYEGAVKRLENERAQMVLF
jgi:site-specific DNA-methyltransferase (adenine-specific)